VQQASDATSASEAVFVGSIEIEVYCTQLKRLVAKLRHSMNGFVDSSLTISRFRAALSPAISSVYRVIVFFVSILCCLYQARRGTVPPRSK
jgi:hypothetical protein